MRLTRTGLLPWSRASRNERPRRGNDREDRSSASKRFWRRTRCIVPRIWTARRLPSFMWQPRRCERHFTRPTPGSSPPSATHPKSCAPGIAQRDSRRKLPTRIALRAGVILAAAGRSPYNQNLTASARTTGPRCIQMLRFDAEQGPRSPSNVPHQRPTRLIQLAWTAWKRTRRRRGPPFFIAS